ncbi:MAG: hypothetical protein LiPW15_723 [Parcubacteria group bacterium LiPW_15]|nr:MAG: hypothetical protein LiPW15_723 [Parcubacteria group bacterium LiPW_15]
MFHDPSLVEVLSSLAVLKFLPLIGFWSPGFDSHRERPAGCRKRITSKFRLDDVGILLRVRGDALARLTLTELLKILRETSNSTQLKLERRGRVSDRCEMVPISHIGIEINLFSAAGMREWREAVPLKDFREWWRRCGERMQNLSYTIPGHFLTDPKKHEIPYEGIMLPVAILSTREDSELLPDVLQGLVSGREVECVRLTVQRWFAS